MEQRLDLRLPAKPSAVGEARRSLAAVASLPDDHLWRAQLVVSELATNVVRHGGLPDVDHFVVHLQVSPSRLRIEVCNSVPPIELREPSAPWPNESGGMGLYLVDRLADRWGVDGSCVWVELDLAWE